MGKSGYSSTVYEWKIIQWGTLIKIYISISLYNLLDAISRIDPFYGTYSIKAAIFSGNEAGNNE